MSAGMVFLGVAMSGIGLFILADILDGMEDES